MNAAGRAGGRAGMAESTQARKQMNARGSEMNARGSEAKTKSGAASSRGSRLLKRALIAVGVVAAVVVILFSVARAMFPAAKLRELAVAKLEQATGLDISVRDARISFVHWHLGVKVSDVDVSRPGEDTKLASIPRAGAAVALLPLLRREIVVSEVYVDEPRIEIVTGEPTPPRVSKAGTKSAAAAPALSFQLPKAVVNDAEIVLRDLKAGREIRLDKLDVTSRAKAGKGFEVVTSSGRFSVGRVSATSLANGKPLFPGQSAKGTWKILARPKQQLLEIEKVAVSLAEVPLELTGRVVLASPKAAGIDTVSARPNALGPDLDLKVVMKDVALEKLASLAPAEVVSKVEKASRGGALNVVSAVKGRLPSPQVDTRFALTTAGATRLEGRVELGAQEPRLLAFEAKGGLKLEELQALLSAGKGPKARTGDVSLDVRGTAPLEELKKDPYSVEANGRISAGNVRIESGEGAPPVVVEKLTVGLSGRRADVRETVVKLGSSTFNISGSVPDWRKKSFQLKVDSPLLNLKELLQPTSAAGPKKEKKAAPRPMIPIGALGMQGTTRISVAKLTYGGFEANDLNASVLMAGDSVSVENLKMRALGGEADGKARLRVPKDGTPTYTAAFSAADLQLGALLDAFTPLKGLMKGATSFEVALDGALGEEPVPVKSITAAGDVKASDVTAVASPLVSALATWVGLGGNKEYALKNFSTAFSVRDGRLIVPACSLAEKSSVWKFSGSTGLDGSLDQKVNVILSPEYSNRVSSLNGLGQVLKDEQGRVVVDLFLGGTVKKPALRWDHARMQSRAEGYLAGKLKGELEKQIGKKLNVTPEGRTQLQQKADSLRKEAETVGKKLLEGWTKKKK